MTPTATGVGPEPTPPIIQELEQSPSAYLYAVRDAAGQAAETLQEAIKRASGEAEDAHIILAHALEAAERTRAELSSLAANMERAAELVAASDLEPNSSSVIPDEAGLARIAPENALTLEQLHALPDGAYVRAGNGAQWYRSGRYWGLRGAPMHTMTSDVLYAQQSPLHLLENGPTDA